MSAARKESASKAIESLEQSAEPFDHASLLIWELEREISAWRSRFPQYEYRPMDDTVALKLEGPLE